MAGPGLLSGSLRRIAADLPIHAVIGAYAALVYAESVKLGAANRFMPFGYVTIFALLLGAGLMVLLPVAGLRHLRNLVWPAYRSTAMASGRWDVSLLISGLALQTAFLFFLGALTSAKNLMGVTGPYDWDRRLAQIDRAIHFGHDPWVVFMPLLQSTNLVRCVEIAYGPVWLLILLLLPAWVAFREHERLPRLRFFLSMLACWIVLGTLTAATLRSGGPAFYAEFTGGADRFATLMALLSRTHGHPFSAFDMQRYLWQLYESGHTGAGSGISAFPSLHVSMATMFALYLWSKAKLLGLSAGLYVVVIMLGSVMLGWHYAIDGYVSALGTVLIWVFVGRALGVHPQWASSYGNPGLSPRT